MPIDPGAVALDLLIYLADKYASAGEARLAAFVAQAQERSRDFGDWLAALDDAMLEPQERALLMQDLGVTLATMAGASGFACV